MYNYSRTVRDRYFTYKINLRDKVTYNSEKFKINTDNRRMLIMSLNLSILNHNTGGALHLIPYGHLLWDWRTQYVLIGE